MYRAERKSIWIDPGTNQLERVRAGSAATRGQRGQPKGAEDERIGEREQPGGLDGRRHNQSKEQIEKDESISDGKD